MFLSDCFRFYMYIDMGGKLTNSVMYISLMGKILNSPKGVKSGVLERVIIFAAHVASVTIEAKIITRNQSCVTVCEQILQHM